MKVKTNMKAGASLNHNETLVRGTRKAKGLKVKTNVKASALIATEWLFVSNHNETLVREDCPLSFVICLPFNQGQGTKDQGLP